MIHYSGVHHGGRSKWRFRAPETGGIFSTALAVVFSFGLQIVAAEAQLERGGSGARAASTIWNDLYWESLRRSEDVFASGPSTEVLWDDGVSRGSVDESNRANDLQIAQFQLPKAQTDSGDLVSQLPKNLSYEYAYGSESEVLYRKNMNLDDTVRDKQILLVPELNGYITYRPTDWMEATLEMIFQWEIPIEENDITLPSGEVQTSDSSRVSLLVDQLFVTFKNFAGPLNVTIGRQNFEDARHWLYDSSLDVALFKVRGKFQFQAAMGREALVNLDGIKREIPDQVNTWILHGAYRGIENIRIAGYAIYRDDRSGEDGRPLHIGVRSMGNPTENFSYWADASFLRGSDASGRDFSSARGFDIGGTYRFAGLPLNPNVTVGFAYGSGDGNPDDSTNSEFRQTGLQSNETKFAGISEFKIYGEALDPELSNLNILTLGVGVRPVPDVSLDLVYHSYWLDKLAEELRESQITAQLNPNDMRLSKDLGSAFDIVLGMRNVFGVRRLGLDLRAGWFFPGAAYSIDQGGGEFRKANSAVAAVFKVWW